MIFGERVERMITVMLVVLGIATNATASVLIKYAMMPERNVSILEPVSIIVNVPLWFGLLFFCVAFLIYAFILQRLPLNVSYPILTSGSITLVSILSVFFFDEAVTVEKIVGVMLIIIGVTLISLKV